MNRQKEKEGTGTHPQINPRGADGKWSVTKRQRERERAKEGKRESVSGQHKAEVSHPQCDPSPPHPRQLILSFTLQHRAQKGGMEGWRRREGLSVDAPLTQANVLRVALEKRPQRSTLSANQHAVTQAFTR